MQAEVAALCEHINEVKRSNTGTRRERFKYLQKVNGVIDMINSLMFT